MKIILTIALIFFSFITAKAQLPVANFSADDSTICPGNCTGFTNLSTNATSYHWTFAGANPSTSTVADPQGICYNAPGIYSVTLIASNSNGSDTLTIINCVRVYPYSPPLNIAEHGDTFIVATPGFVHYQWYLNGVLIPNDTLNYHVGIPDGWHILVASDSNGCEVEPVDYNLIMNPDFIASDTVICVGDCISFTNLSYPDSGLVSHQWHFYGAVPSVSLENDPQNICYSTPGDYQVKLVMVFPMHGWSDSLIVHVLNCSDIPENIALNQQILISPNPFNDLINLHFLNPKMDNTFVSVFNSVGEIIVEEKITMNDQSLNLSSLPQGIYLVMVRNEHEIWSSKIIK